VLDAELLSHFAKNAESDYGNETRCMGNFNRQTLQKGTKLQVTNFKEHNRNGYL
jgi:hypothetical protein